MTISLPLEILSIYELNSFERVYVPDNHKASVQINEVAKKLIGLGYSVKACEESFGESNEHLFLVPKNSKPLSKIFFIQQNPDYHDSTSTLISHILNDEHLKSLIEANGNYIFFNPEVSNPNKPEGEILILQPFGNESES